jgi:hypothetical protein
MQPMKGWNVVTFLATPVYSAVKKTRSVVVTPGLIGLPVAPRMLTSIAGSLTRASVPPTM